MAKIQVRTLNENCERYGISEFKINDTEQGIVHVIGPEYGACLPGMSIVCGDSHTATNGALAALAFGIGTSEVEHVLATQCLISRKMKNMLIRVNGQLGNGVTPKDVILAIIGKIGAAAGTGYAIEFGGQVIRDMTMEGRMTVCNMAIEIGARVGLVAVDATTLRYVKGRRFAPTGEQWTLAAKHWQELVSDGDAEYDAVIEIDGSRIEPQVSWGTSPDMVTQVGGSVPDPAHVKDATQRADMQRALNYMDLKPGQPVSEIKLDKVFIGSCTNSRIEDLRAAAQILKGRHKAASVKQAIVVPGSGMVKAQAEREGLDKIFTLAGFEWRAPGCSMCVAMNPDRLAPTERCASTSNRNFENRQGKGGRTHLVSPAMAAAAAVHGHFVDVRTL